jgi:nitrite reductase/ring-hydroxylating ferredoxin subunit
MDEQTITRREVLERSALAGAAVVATCGACGALGSGLSACAVEKKESVITTGVVNVGSPAQYPAGTASTAFLAQYGIVITNDSGTPLAIRPKCTHKGCTVKWHAEHFQFECPCHGSKFDLLGQPTHGPATKPLAGVAAVRQADGTLTVNLDQLYAMPV